MSFRKETDFGRVKNIEKLWELDVVRIYPCIVDNSWLKASRI